MTSKALIPGAYDSITGNGQFQCDGAGSMNFIGIPQNQPANSRAFRVLNAVLFMNSDNSNGTLDTVYPSAGGADVTALAFVIPNQRVNPGDIDAIGNPLSIAIPVGSLGPGVKVTLIESAAAAGLNQAIWVLDSEREIVVPFGYTFGMWLRDSADGTPHNLTATLLCQIQWMEQDCGC